MKEEDNLLNQPNKDKRITSHKGSKPKLIDIENNLVEFIEFNRKLNNPNTTWCLANEIFKYYPNLKNENYLNITKWIYRFLDRNHFSFRRSTHLGQALPKSSIDIASQFLSSVYNSRLNMKYSDDLIGNLDETPLCINMAPNYSISQKGKKSVIIHTQSQDKCHVSVILTILANGGKLPPLLIFKGVPHGKIYKDLLNNTYVKNNMIYIECNANARCTKDIMLQWINNIWRKYIDAFNNEPIPCLLIMDQATMHTNEVVIKELEKKDTEIHFIPKGMTCVLQPLDVSINKPFKAHLKNRYIKYCYDKNSVERVSRELLINWVAEIWWDNNLISPDIIKNSFKVTGLSNNLDGSENDLFTGFKRLEEIIVVEDDEYEKNDMFE